MVSHYENHKRKWIHCKRCALHKHRLNVVLLRGSVPCDILFIGEAPGASEDVLGRPFVGPAGKILDQLIANAVSTAYRYAITNLVGCIPKDDDSESKIPEPPDYAIKACASRLQEIVAIARPKLFVFVGKLAAKHFSPSQDYCEDERPEFVEIIHPAAILRMDISQQGLAYQRSVIAVRDAIESCL